MSCKYFQIESLVFSVISHFHKCLKIIYGRNSVDTVDSVLKISSFLYKISKNRSGYIFKQCLNTFSIFTFLSSVELSSLNHNNSIEEEHSGNVINKSLVKSLIIVQKFSGIEFCSCCSFTTSTSFTSFTTSTSSIFTSTSSLSINLSIYNLYNYFFK